MTPLAPPADQAVRHAVDAYIDGRLLPTFEGEASFETRNSTYRVLDGVLYAAPDHGLLGAELVGWLVEFVARAEVSQAWRPGARAILVDTRNDGVKGPHIIVTSATRAFRKDRIPSAPSLPAAGSHPTQDGSTMPQRWGQRAPQPAAARDLHASIPRHDLPALPPIPAAPGSPSWGLHPIAPPPPVQRRPATLPPPPMPAHLPRLDADLRPAAAPVAARRSSVPPPPAGRHLPPTIPPPAMVPMIVKPATLPPPPPPRLLPRALPPPPPVEDDYIARRIAATLGAAVAAADDLDDAAPTAREARHPYARDVRQAFADDFGAPSDLHAPPPREARGRSTSRLSQGASSFATSGRAVAPLPPASVPFLLSRSHQRGVPLR